MNASANARERWSAERLARWQSRPDAKRVARQYSEWVRSEAGMLVMLQLSSSIWFLVAGKLSRMHFKAQLRQIAKAARLPIDDLKIMAKGIEEIIRCGLYGSGQLTPSAGEGE